MVAFTMNQLYRTTGGSYMLLILFALPPVE